MHFPIYMKIVKIALSVGLFNFHWQNFQLLCDWVAKLDKKLEKWRNFHVCVVLLTDCQYLSTHISTEFVYWISHMLTYWLSDLIYWILYICLHSCKYIYMLNVWPSESWLNYWSTDLIIDWFIDFLDVWRFLPYWNNTYSHTYYLFT